MSSSVRRVLSGIARGVRLHPPAPAATRAVSTTTTIRPPAASAPDIALIYGSGACAQLRVLRAAAVC